MSYMKNKITEERDKIEVFKRCDFEHSCTKELKTHPQDMGFLINVATPDKAKYLESDFDYDSRMKQEKLKFFEFYPDFEFECTRAPYHTFKQYKEWKDLLKGMSGV